MNLWMGRLGSAGIGVAVIAALLAEAGYFLVAQSTARTAAREHARRAEAWRKLAAADPPVTEAGAAAAESELRRVESLLAETAAALGAADEAGTRRTGADRAMRPGVDAFFELSGFVRRMRAQAATAGVGLAADAQFGFSAYSHEAPDAAVAAGVESQRRAVETLLALLWDAHPRQLEAVQRTVVPTSPTGNRAPAPGQAPGSAADLFGRDGFRSLAAPKVIETDAFRLVFVGRTAALRGFLNALAASAEPLAVRDVTAEPVKEAAPRPGRPGQGADPLSLVLRPGWTRFAVTVERWSLVAPIPDRHDVEPRTAGAADRWSEAAAQARGAGWIYDLFTPPSVYLDARRGALLATGTTAGPDAADAGAELELLAVQRAPFRWQLAGYVGLGSSARGIFTDGRTGGSVVAGRGERLGDDGCEVIELATRRIVGSGADGTTAEPETVAVVREAANGEDRALTSQSICRAGAPVGSFRSRKDAEFRCELVEGQSVSLNGTDYCVERLELQPPQAVVARVPTGGGAPSVFVLTPPPPDPEPERAAARPHPANGTAAFSLSP